ncbi:MAG: peptidoglycan-binding protein [Brachybacterium sp.]|uniref:peptidoglycan-binding protein n=1 Tax=Brachybacterium sp. TaxID=1891286 RepID=UPI002647E10A|nr:peptidoglycan-binding protein [Brachybacterium sp.]MDN5685815.1 peptidoglycan-binding protein [Brachybacterium sp.]
MALLTLSRSDSRLKDLPRSWSNAGREEALQQAPAESLSNFLALAVAKSKTNFQLYDAHRSLEEQESIFFDRYERTNWGSKHNSSDRYYKGSVWRHVKGAAAASPGFSKHGSGLAIDVHPGPIQEIFKREGRAWGWSWDEGQSLGEDWHFVFEGGNRYASRGWLDHAWVQKVVGAEVDGKIGTGTVDKIRAWQTAHGLEADGIVGPGTKAAMLGGSAADVADEVADAVEDVKAVGDLAPASAGLFPWADTEAQSFDSKYPTQEYLGGKPKGLLHSTETGTWPGYSGGSIAPHLTIRFHPDSKTVEARQHFRTDRPSRALANASGGVQTNNWQVFQIELIGSCDRAFATKHDYLYLPDLLTEPWARDALGAVLASVSASLDIPLASSVSWARYPGSYGESASQRLTGSQWDEYTGWLGHQHAPENDHGDPGDIPVAQILTAAGGNAGAVVVNPTPAGDLADQFPHGKDALMAMVKAPDFPLLRTPGHLCYYGPADGPMESVSGKSPNSDNPGEIFSSGMSSGAQGLKTWQAKMGIEADGRYGSGTEAKVRALQKRAGLKVDGKIGPSTWYAPFLLWP